MDTDRNLLFVVLALQADLIDLVRFAEVCSAWATRKETSIAELLVERGWLTPTDRADIERLLARKLKKHADDCRGSLAAAADAGVRRVLAAVEDAAIRQSVGGLPPLPEAEERNTTDYIPAAGDRYTLSRLHATGGIGRVWLARDANLGREVALKELRPERPLHPEASGRFVREARITGQLEHPGIVPVYELGQRPEDQSPYYTMRFVRGRTLAEAVAAYHAKRTRGEARPSELRELLTALLAVCHAVAYAHARGVLHRDLKPKNVVLGDYGEVLLLDWGLARVMDTTEAEAGAAPPELDLPGWEEGTMQGQVLGTPAYMAPEQAEGRLNQLGPATDTYGLGAILYEILTGRPPFLAAETTEVLRRVVHEPPAAPRSVVTDTSRALEAVCLKALHKDVAKRYGAAQDLARELQQWLADEPVAAYREPRAVRAGRWVRRHRLLVTSMTAAGLVALIGLAVVLGLQAQANRDLRAANQREHQRFDLALDAIRKYHTGVSEELLLKEDRFKELRDRLLRDAVGFYRKLEDQLSQEGDPRSRRALGNAYYAVGELTLKIGSAEEALVAHQAALEVRRGLVASGEGLDDLGHSMIAVGMLLEKLGRPDEALAVLDEARAQLSQGSGPERADAKVQGVLAYAHYWTGLLHFNGGKLDQAQAAYQQARVISEELTRSDPSVADYQRVLSWCHNDLARVFVEVGKPDEALTAFEKARQLKQSLADAHPKVAEYQRDLALGYINRGTALAAVGRPIEAIGSFEMARGILLSLTRTHPAVTPFQNDLALCHYNTGHQHNQAGKVADAEACFKSAAAIWLSLAAANPAIPDFASDRAASLHQVGNLCAKQGRWEEAGKAYEEVLAVCRRLAEAHPSRRQFQLDLAASLSRFGILQQQRRQFAEAAAAFRKAIELTERHSGPEGSNYDLGCLHALLAAVAVEPGSGLTAAEGLVTADQAMSHLRRAVARGYKNIAHLRTDTDLDGLRRRPDFQELLRGLEASQP